MTAVNKVLIVGGGIGGLSAAIGLRRAGIDVDLVEIKKEWTVYHVGVVIQGNAIRALAALGIAEKCVDAGFPYDGLEFCDLEGHVLMDIHGIPLAGPNLPSDLGLARPALHRVLSESALQLGTKVRLGVSFTDITEGGKKASVAFTDGSRSDYDLVIGADGVFSKTRKLLYGDKYVPAFTGQCVWRYNLTRPPEMTRAAMFVGLEGGKCGYIPLSKDTCYALLVQAESSDWRLPEEQLASIFRARLARCTGLMARLRDQITDSSLVVYRPLEAVFVSAPWHRGRIVMLGDAVHATTPHMGQGAAQAIEDAVVLGELLARDEPLADLLARYSARRYERCKFVFEASLQIGEWEQHPGPDANPMGLTAKLMPTLAAPI